MLTMVMLSACPRQKEGERCDFRAGEGENSDCGDGLKCIPSGDLCTNADICCPDPATNVKVRVFFTAKIGDNYPDLPADFWASFPDANHASPVFWLPIGPAITVPEIRPSEPSVVSWNWTVPHTPGSTVGLLAVMTNAQDPVNEARRTVEDVVRTNKHVALREISPGIPTAAIFVLVLLGIGVAGIVTAAVLTDTI